MTQQDPRQPSGSEPLADKIIHRIEQEGVVPKPRWQFSLTNQIFWAVWALSLVFAAAAVAALIFALANAGWEYRAATHESFVAFLLDILPLFWVAAVSLLMLIAYENLKRTKLGYRYPVKLIVGVGLVGVVLGGAVLFVSGIGKEVEEKVGRHIPTYRPVFEKQRKAWLNPGKGLLGGEVIYGEPAYATFTVRAFDGGLWVINSTDLTPRDRVFINERNIIRVIGFPDGAATSTAEPPVFHACMVFPWEAKPPAKREPVRNAPEMRITKCKDIRPYDALMKVKGYDGR